MLPHENIDLIAQSLKTTLREQGVSYADLGGRIGRSESSVKRLFSKKSFSLDLLEKICGHLGISLFDLMDRAKGAAAVEIYTLTEKQEKMLAANPRFYCFFWLVVNRVPLKRILSAYHIPMKEAERYLLQLNRFKLIDLKPHNRFTILVPRTVQWSAGGPIDKFVVANTLSRFLKGRFDRPEDYHRFIIAKLTPESMLQFKIRFKALADELFEQSTMMESTLKKSKTMGLVVALGQTDFSLVHVLEAALRGKQQKT